MTVERTLSKLYTLYIDDDRYSVPSLDAVDAEDDEAASAAAQLRLALSPHYRAIEVWDGDRCVTRLQ